VFDPPVTGDSDEEYELADEGKHYLEMRAGAGMSRYASKKRERFVGNMTFNLDTGGGSTLNPPIIVRDGGEGGRAAFLWQVNHRAPARTKDKRLGERTGDAAVDAWNARVRKLRSAVRKTRMTAKVQAVASHVSEMCEHQAVRNQVFEKVDLESTGARHQYRTELPEDVMTTRQALSLSSKQMQRRMAHSKQNDTLKLSNSDINGFDIPALVYSMSHGHVTRLLLHDNKVRDGGVDGLVSGLMAAPHTLDTLQEIDLSQCLNIGVTGGKALGRLLHVPKISITVLRLAGCEGLGVHGITPLIEALSSNRSLKTLDISKCNISPEGLHCIAALISDNPVLTDLDLSWNKLGSGNTLAPWQQVHASLKDNLGITSLDLSWNGLNDDVAKHLFDAVTDNEVLRTFSLESNRVTNESGPSLLKLVKKAKHLQLLKLGSNPLGYRMTQRVMSTMVQNGNLVVDLASVGIVKSMHLSENPVFKAANPAGYYVLDLADQQHWAFAAELVKHWAAMKDTVNVWHEAKLDGRPCRMFASRNWPEKMPTKGILRVRIAPSLVVPEGAEHLPDSYFQALLSMLERSKNQGHTWMREFLQLVGSALTLSVEQVCGLVAMFSTQDTRVMAAYELLPRCTDPENFGKLQEVMHMPEWSQILEALGPMFMFSHSTNPTSTYVLDLSYWGSYAVAAKLRQLYSREVEEGLAEQPSKCCWRGVLLSGKAVAGIQQHCSWEALQGWQVPRGKGGVLDLSYVSYRQAGRMPLLGEDAFARLERHCADPYTTIDNLGMIDDVQGVPRRGKVKANEYQHTLAMPLYPIGASDHLNVRRVAKAGEVERAARPEGGRPRLTGPPPRGSSLPPKLFKAVVKELGVKKKPEQQPLQPVLQVVALKPGEELFQLCEEPGVALVKVTKGAVQLEKYALGSLRPTVFGCAQAGDYLDDARIALGEVEHRAGTTQRRTISCRAMSEGAEVVYATREKLVALRAERPQVMDKVLAGLSARDAVKLEDTPPPPVEYDIMTGRQLPPFPTKPEGGRDPMAVRYRALFRSVLASWCVTSWQVERLCCAVRQPEARVDLVQAAWGRVVDRPAGFGRCLSVLRPFEQMQACQRLGWDTVSGVVDPQMHYHLRLGSASDRAALEHVVALAERTGGDNVINIEDLRMDGVRMPKRPRENKDFLRVIDKLAEAEGAKTVAFYFKR